MDWPTAVTLSIATICGAGMFIACRIAKTFDPEPLEYLDTVDLPPEHRRDETLILALPRDDYLGWNDGQA